MKSISSPTVKILIGGAFYLSSDIAFINASSGGQGFSFLSPDKIEMFCPFDWVLLLSFALFESSLKSILECAFDLFVFLGSFSAKFISLISEVSEHI